ncbi:DUF4349 domain-containing protein [Candidatus Nanohalococcus occultus]|uniref:DUF4349 family protein n=1 Tax=Candidatus Nanohalococcus occultus TaxID=2978047 RepID=A0ABY8CEF1_9ARCH|nr:DUF4349 family protein [Candidatus Nanohaloarchaeota archaeon SVXNc]
MLDKAKSFGKENSTVLLAAAAVLIVAVGGLSTHFMGTNGNMAYQGQQLAAGTPNALTMDARESVTAASTAERKRIETYSLDFEAVNIRSAVDDSIGIAEQFGGYSTGENFYNNENGANSASVTLRVPSENVSEFMDELDAKNWKLESKNRNVNDVTERYTELELELENKRQELEKLEELMEDANRTEDLIKIQERMGELRSRIQYLETQLEDIDRRVDYTRISLQFEEPEPITSEFELRNSFTDAYRAIFTTISWTIVGIGYLLPFAVLYGVYRAFKRVRRE